MSTYTPIFAAIHTAIRDYADPLDIKVALPNVEFDTDKFGGDVFFSVFDLPVETSLLGLADGDAEDNSGLVQLNVNVPKGNGTKVLWEQITALFGVFAKNRILDGTVIIVKSWAAPAVDINQGWHTVPINISYRSLV